jgi:DNA-binding NarL/FixJ family response regulator
MARSEPISLLVINDVQLVVEGLVAMMEPFDKRITIAGAAIGELEPIEAEVALVDAFGHPNAGVERISEVIELGSVERVCLYTWKLSPAQAVEAIDRGAAGILSKSAPATELVRDIERIHEGARVVHEFPVHVWTPTWLETSDTSLTARELELLSFVASGLTNAEISRAMFLAESSVKTYLKRVYRKLGINSRSQAVMRAVELGIAGPHAGAGAAG